MTESYYREEPSLHPFAGVDMGKALPLSEVQEQRLVIKRLQNECDLLRESIKGGLAREAELRKAKDELELLIHKREQQEIVACVVIGVLAIIMGML